LAAWFLYINASLFLTLWLLSRIRLFSLSCHWVSMLCIPSQYLLMLMILVKQRCCWHRSCGLWDCLSNHDFLNTAKYTIMLFIIEGRNLMSAFVLWWSCSFFCRIIFDSWRSQDFWHEVDYPAFLNYFLK
jgi:hypothetical protein